MPEGRRSVNSFFERRVRAGIESGHPLRRRRAGFTTLELVLVVVVMGVMASIALPRANSATRQRRVISAAHVLAADVPVAFSLAARQRKPVLMSWDAASGEVRVTDRATGTVYLRRPLKSTSEYQLDSVSMTPSSVTLFPTGISSASLTFRLSSGSYARQVTVARTGLTRVTVP